MQNNLIALRNQIYFLVKCISKLIFLSMFLHFMVTIRNGLHLLLIYFRQSNLTIGRHSTGHVCEIFILVEFTNLRLFKQENKKYSQFNANDSSKSKLAYMFFSKSFILTLRLLKTCKTVYMPIIYLFNIMNTVRFKLSKLL